MNSKDNTRRSFLKKSIIGAAALTVPFTASSYRRIIGSNERLNIAVAGLNGRGNGHIYASQNLKKHISVIGLCDVDKRVFPKVFEKFHISIIIEIYIQPV